LGIDSLIEGSICNFLKSINLILKPTNKTTIDNQHFVAGGFDSHALPPFYSQFPIFIEDISLTQF